MWLTVGLRPVAITTIFSLWALLIGLLVGANCRTDRPRDPAEALPARMAVSLGYKHRLWVVPDHADKSGAWSAFYLVAEPRNLADLAALSRHPDRAADWSGVLHVLPAGTDRLAPFAEPAEVPEHWRARHRVTRPGDVLFGDPDLVARVGEDLDR